MDLYPCRGVRYPRDRESSKSKYEHLRRAGRGGRRVGAQKTRLAMAVKHRPWVPLLGPRVSKTWQKRGNTRKGLATEVTSPFGGWWADQDSNQGHQDFQSSKLESTTLYRGQYYAATHGLKSERECKFVQGRERTKGGRKVAVGKNRGPLHFFSCDARGGELLSRRGVF